MKSMKGMKGQGEGRLTFGVVVPAQAGTQSGLARLLDSRLRGNDDRLRGNDGERQMLVAT